MQQWLWATRFGTEASGKEVVAQAFPTADSWEGGWLRDSLRPASGCVGVAGASWLGLEGLKPAACDWSSC